MRKLAVCCLAIAVVVMFVPAAQAGTKCYHLTNFCDGLEATNSSLGGNAGTLVAGLWAWQCSNTCPGSLVVGVPNKFGGQPLYPYSGGTGAGFAAMFAFKPSSHMFDLNVTMDGFTFQAFQINQPYTTTNGVCSCGKANDGKMPATLRK